MSNLQKIIKYFAIAFALVLTFSIINGLMNVVLIFNNITDNNDSKTEPFSNMSIDENTSILDIDVKAVNLIFKEGDKLLAETNNKYIQVRQDNNQIKIRENRQTWSGKKLGDLIIYVPAGLVFDKVSIKSGVGKTTINDLNAKKLDLEVGAGNMKINNLNVTDTATIDGGVGEITISSGTINDLDLEVGVGKLNLTSKLLGKSKIESGVGAVKINLVGTIDDYKIIAEKGIGSITIDNNIISSESTYGTGINDIEIEGGIGAIDVKFIER